jgi:lipopolysaccharide/colanic/teichoic acid biosynthesis glycosyltransferase
VTTHRLTLDGSTGADPVQATVRLRYWRAKDVLDVTIAAVLLVVLSPVLAAVAIAIKLDSRGPVLFVQERTGVRRRRIGGRLEWEPSTFRFLKFRSMVHNADPSLHEAHIMEYVAGGGATDGARARFKVADDPRITRVGRVTRRLSLDELPQLLNVLKREMSMVGPRPVPPYEAAHYLTRYPERFAALPGITGLWQVRGRCDLSSDEMAELDVEYVENQSLLLDAKILFQTIPAVITGRGAA